MITRSSAKNILEIIMPFRSRPRIEAFSLMPRPLINILKRSGERLHPGNLKIKHCLSRLFNDLA